MIVFFCCAHPVVAVLVAEGNSGSNYASRREAYCVDLIGCPIEGLGLRCVFSFWGSWLATTNGKIC